MRTTAGEATAFWPLALALVAVLVGVVVETALAEPLVNSTFPLSFAVACKMSGLSTLFAISFTFTFTFALQRHQLLGILPPFASMSCPGYSPSRG